MSITQPHPILLPLTTFQTFQGRLSKKRFFNKVNVFWNNFQLKKYRENTWNIIVGIPHVETPRNNAFLTPKGQFENLTLGQVKWMTWPDEWPRYVILHRSRCSETRQTQWHLASGYDSITWGVIDVNVSVTCDDVIYDDVIWPVPTGVIGWKLCLIHC